METTLNLLLIEDESNHADLVRHYLKAVNFAVDMDWAATVEDGTRMLNQKSYVFCLIDFNLGKQSGLDLIREQIAAGCRTPLIMITNHSDPLLADAALEAGAADFIEKTGSFASDSKTSDSPFA